MRILALEEIQNIELKLLLEFDEICKKNNLRYSLGGGSLLGAVRHKGFIPWDDDIDVMMPRPDYEKFISSCEGKSVNFKLLSYDTIEGYNELFAKIWEPETIIKDDLVDMPYEIGVSIDVFPIDGLGSSESEALRIFRKTAWNRELLTASHWSKFSRSKTHSIFIEPIRFCMFVLSRFAKPQNLLRKIDEENLKHHFEDSKYAGCVCGSYREKEIMTTETFENYIEIDFEGHKLSVIKNYDEYLTKHYGDYMKLPPENKRQTHHTFNAYMK